VSVKKVCECEKCMGVWRKCVSVKKVRECGGSV
jgi:hypothetical protein